jgi:rod shape-determining protein MreC
MYGLLKFIIKYHFTILFLFLEIIALSLAVSFNKHQNTVYLSSANAIAGYVNTKTANIKSYFNLKEKNEILTKQNAQLLTQQKNNYLSNTTTKIKITDTLKNYIYYYTDAKIIKNTVYHKHNYITLNKGRENGISVGDGVIAPNGVIGVITKVSAHFSNVISLLNTNLFISVKIKRDNYFGSLNWNGKDYRYVKLREIPFHVKLQKGDTIVTSGFSMIFPSGIPVGTIKNFTKQNDGDFYDIDIELFTNFKNIDNVYIVSNLKRNELNTIKESDD